VYNHDSRSVSYIEYSDRLSLKVQTSTISNPLLKAPWFQHLKLYNQNCLATLSFHHGATAAVPCTATNATTATASAAHQGLPLVHYSPQRKQSCGMRRVVSMTKWLRLSLQVDECKPLPPTRTSPRPEGRPRSRVLHSSTFLLIVSKFCVI